MKAMILAAGRGLRMRPLTDHTHKGMLKVAGVPIIERHVKNLAGMGVQDIVINVSYLAEQIQGFLGSGSKYGVNIQYSIEQQPLEVGGGIIKALPLLGNTPFLVVNCDVWTAYPLQQLKTKLKNDLGHIVLVKNPDHNPGGDFVLERQRVGLKKNENTQSFTYAGIALYHPDLFQSFPTCCCQPMLPILQYGIETQKISGECYEGLWCDVGTPDRLAQLQKEFI